MLTQLRTIGIQVTDQERSLDFFVNVLGFEKTADHPMGPEMRWIVVTPRGAETGIVLSKGYGPGTVGGFTGYIFATDDMTSTYDTLTARGVVFSTPPRVESWGHWAQFADPDGNEFGIWTPVP